ncbi:hypothetical protein L3V83_11645 [Thiotrichales bacterium 19X7-9]|nr:hypothetical protein [Thiotrichales bacterium 19X7-9]
MILTIIDHKTEDSFHGTKKIREELNISYRYTVEKQFFKDNQNKEYKIYKIATDDKDKKVGILATNNFYFVFDYEHCCKGGKLDLLKVSGWLESAHGKVIKGFSGNHPFTPPDGNWKINFMGPSGSILYSSFDKAREIAEIKTYGQWSRVNGIVSQKVWQTDEDSMLQNVEKSQTSTDEDKIYKTIRDGEKFLHTNKLVGGSKAHPNRIMNVSLTPDRSEHNIQHMYALVEQSNDAGCIYARNEKSDLKGMLSDMHKLEMNQVLAVNSCRGYDKDNQIMWDDEYNQGPTIADSLHVSLVKQPPILLFIKQCEEECLQESLSLDD